MNAGGGIWFNYPKPVFAQYDYANNFEEDYDTLKAMYFRERRITTSSLSGTTWKHRYPESLW